MAFVVAALLAVALTACRENSSNGTGGVDEEGHWTVVAPRQVDLDAGSLASADAYVHKSLPQVTSLLVARHGLLAAEHYYGGTQASTEHQVFSVTKSVISALTGIALEEGSLDGLDEQPAELLPDLRSLVESDPVLRRVTLRDLLTMSAGFAGDDADPDGGLGFTSSADWVAALLERPIVSEPGRTFAYDTGSTHLVSAALTRAVSQPAADVARARLFKRMGIDTWGFRGWSEYGYLWWRYPGREDGYLAAGYGGQFVVVWPSADMLMVVTAIPASGDLGLRPLAELVLAAARSA